MAANHHALSVSISVAEFVMLQELQSRLRRLDIKANNSTPLRAGIRLLAGMSDAELLDAVAKTPSIPRGPRPGAKDRVNDTREGEIGEIP